MSEDKKKIVSFEDGNLLVQYELEKSFDPNKDGEPVASVSLQGKIVIYLSEIPDEAYDAWKKMKDKKES